MKNKKGFTLIELLAVIVILAIIALIATPIILGIINDANKSTFKDTAYSIISAGEIYFAEQQLNSNGIYKDVIIELPAQANTTGGLPIKGDIPTGKVKVTTEGNVALAIQNGRYCITKGYFDNDVTLSEDIEDCEIKKTLSELIVGTNECATNRTEGACPLGTLFTINVSDNETKQFYVIKDYGKKVILLMARPLGSKVSWYADAKDTSQGPITTINYIDETTDDEWSNIPKRNYTYSGIAQDGKKRVYEDITRKMRARMISYDEAVTIVADNNGEVPQFLSKYQLWTSTAHVNSNGYSKSNANMLINGLPTANVTTSKHDVLTVIELDK